MNNQVIFRSNLIKKIGDLFELIPQNTTQNIQAKLQNMMTDQKAYITQVNQNKSFSTFNIQAYMHPKHIQLKEGFQSISLEHVPLLKIVLTNTFLERNQIWKTFTMNRDQLQDFFQRTVLLHLQCQEFARKKFGPNFTTLWMVVRNGKIVSSGHHFEIDTYKEIVMKSGKEEKLPLFKALQSEGKKLIEGVDLSKYAPGTAVYADFGGVNPEFNLTSNDRLFILNSYNLAMKKCGVRWVIGRLSNVKVAKLYENVGGRVVNKVMFERDGLKFPLYFIELDMENPKFLELEKNFHLVEQKYFQYLNQQKAKL